MIYDLKLKSGDYGIHINDDELIIIDKIKVYSKSFKKDNSYSYNDFGIIKTITIKSIENKKIHISKTRKTYEYTKQENIIVPIHVFIKHYLRYKQV